MKKLTASTFLIILTLICLALFFAMCVSSSARSQSPQVVYIHRVDEHTILITVDGVEQIAIDLAKAKEIKATERTLAEREVEIIKLQDNVSKLQDKVNQAVANVQDERVRVGLCEEREKRAQQMETECFALLKKNGTGVRSWLDKWPVQLARDVVPSAVQIAKCK